MAQEADNEEVEERLTRFFSKLDLDCEPSCYVSPREGLPKSLGHSFRSIREIDELAKDIQDLKGTYSSREELVAAIAKKLKEKPLVFLFFMHLFRQIRFTNVELIHFMFDRKRLGDLGYHRALLQSSTIFRSKVQSMLRREPWKSFAGGMKEQKKSQVLWSTYPEDEKVLLSLFKKAVSMYIGDEQRHSAMWLERVRTDEDVRQRIAEFLVDGEDLGHVIEHDMVGPLFDRSVATLNVEEVKAKRGKLGSEKVRDVLQKNGFVYKDFGEIVELDDVQRELEAGSYTDAYIYTVEKKLDIGPRERGKVFDFVLCSPSGVQYVIETNYYTTAMSKIREVVENFKRLNIACKEHDFPLIYITDGVGWLSLMKPVREMIEFDLEQIHKEISGSG
ncbi:MAG: DpnII family type II restriction endonuclease, partial [Thermoplasmata archaeon]